METVRSEHFAPLNSISLKMLKMEAYQNFFDPPCNVNDRWMDLSFVTCPCNPDMSKGDGDTGVLNPLWLKNKNRQVGYVPY